MTSSTAGSSVSRDAPSATAGLAQRKLAGLDVLIRPGTGTGIPLLMLHGIGSRSFSFLPLIDALDPALTVIAWDAPGYGGSRPLDAAAPEVADYAAAAVALLDALAIPSVDLLGHSLGTLIASHVAAVAPRRVRRLVLLSPTLGYGIAPGQPLPAAVAARPAELAALGAETFARKRAPRLVYAPDRKVAVTDAVITAMATMAMPGYGQAAHLLGSGRLLDDIARLHCPTLVAVGAEDVVTPPDVAQRVAQALPPAAATAPDAILIEDCGHAVYLEDPKTVAALVARHLGGERS